MATFNQSNTNIMYQTNAEYAFVGVSTNVDFLQKLRSFSSALGEIPTTDTDKSKALEAKNQVDIAITEITKPDHDKSIVQSSLKLATHVLKDAVSLGALYEAALKASEIASKLI